jgi:ATPase subunit of ABC transporter with duplicated ATPase domains
LLEAIADGRLENWPQTVNVYLVRQDASMERTLKPVEAVLNADSMRKALDEEAAGIEREMEVAAATDDKDRLEELLGCLDAVFEKFEDDGQRQWRAENVLRGVGFDDCMLEQPLGQLSGGWQMRASLAAGLFMRPQLLLLDEPTNQLDLDAIIWLQHHLVSEYQGTVLCVSHDRAFVNEVATEIISFADQCLHYFSGNLDSFDREASKSACNLQRQSDALEKERVRIQDQIMHMRQVADKMDDTRSVNKQHTKCAPMQQSKTNGQIAQRIKKLGRMGLEKTVDGKRYKAQNTGGPRIGAMNNNDGGWVDGKMTAAPLLQRGDPALRFAFEATDPLELGEDEYLFELHGLSYAPPGGQAVLHNVDLRIAENCRIGCIGKNGAGKSTLLRLLTGELRPTKGGMTRHHGLRIAYMGQHDSEDLLLAETAIDHMQKRFPRTKTDDLMSTLESFGICESVASRSLASLSGGQRIRVSFAVLSVERPNLLILDEPTNHLDIYAIEALIDALKAFSGGVIFVTHNMSLLQDVVQQVITVQDSTVKVEHMENRVLSLKSGIIKADNMTLLS